MIGIVAIAGAALALLGTMLPWLDIGGATANGFDGGYLTGSSMGDGNDGIIIVLLAAATAAVAAHYFFGRNKLAAIGVLVLGAAAGLVSAYNMVRLYSDLRDLCSGGGCSAMSSIGMGYTQALPVARLRLVRRSSAFGEARTSGATWCRRDALCASRNLNATSAPHTAVAKATWKIDVTRRVLASSNVVSRAVRVAERPDPDPCPLTREGCACPPVGRGFNPQNCNLPFGLKRGTY